MAKYFQIPVKTLPLLLPPLRMNHSCKQSEKRNTVINRLKILVLSFADDTVLFGTNEADLQYTLDLFEHYNCEHMKLTVNVSKTKIVIFSSSRGNKKLHFTFQSNRIDTVNDYKYLGIAFAKNGSFTLAKKHIILKPEICSFARKHFRSP